MYATKVVQYAQKYENKLCKVRLLKKLFEISLHYTTNVVYYNYKEVQQRKETKL